MTVFSTIGSILGAWTASVANAIIAGSGRIVSPRVVRLVETDDGAFTVEATAKAGKADSGPSRIAFAEGALSAPNLAPLFRGKRVEIILQPKRFLFRPLELPARAADFVEGIVRAQIDRLTPWSAAEAVFGCTAPVAGGSDTISTIIAATTRKVATGYTQAVAAFNPSAVAVCTDVEGQTTPVKVFEQSACGRLDAARLKRGLQIVLGTAAAVAVLSVAISTYVASSLDAQEDEVARQISARRAAVRAGAGGGDRSPIAVLERRKHETPSSVIVLETLSRVLPDHTYVTELHLAGDKLQISGITGDAPSLIPLIERSQHFTRATFYAPTTRARSDPGERFHIEAHVEPKNTLNAMVTP
ncbi:PilN domain-containing protein [Bradyrhizobium jicamae]|uniref:PilN domain-containing protein n=1 Tax=Bradyrhizobium jicamae TaxID=280332 RepID=UPI001BA6534E|nr:PilN domain-containing protein [Bradyrhizobium jicamae]MBR0938007.1 PilN domain-containing protein [Bradyrhizobium jicamae]